jgi:hypothetical protein
MKEILAVAAVLSALIAGYAYAQVQVGPVSPSGRFHVVADVKGGAWILDSTFGTVARCDSTGLDAKCSKFTPR